MKTALYKFHLVHLFHDVLVGTILVCRIFSYGWHLQIPDRGRSRGTMERWGMGGQKGALGGDVAGALEGLVEHAPRPGPAGDPLLLPAEVLLVQLHAQPLRILLALAPAPLLPAVRPHCIIYMIEITPPPPHLTALHGTCCMLPQNTGAWKAVAAEADVQDVPGCFAGISAVV